MLLATCAFPSQTFVEANIRVVFTKSGGLWRRYPTFMPFLFYLPILRAGVLTSLWNKRVGEARRGVPAEAQTDSL
jgi:hypothetical protein